MFFLFDNSYLQCQFFLFRYIIITFYDIKLWLYVIIQTTHNYGLEFHIEWMNDAFI